MRNAVHIDSAYVRMGLDTLLVSGGAEVEMGGELEVGGELELEVLSWGLKALG